MSVYTIVITFGNRVGNRSTYVLTSGTVLPFPATRLMSIDLLAPGRPPVVDRVTVKNTAKKFILLLVENYTK